MNILTDIYKNETRETKQVKVLMVLEFHKLDKNKQDRIGRGFAVVVRYFEQYSAEEKEEEIYNIITVSDFNHAGGASENSGNSKFIFDNINSLPKETSLQLGFTKYRKISMDENIKKLIQSYNVIKLEKDKNSYPPIIWKAINKTEFNKLIKKGK